MALTFSRYKITDNSGVKFIKCINMYEGRPNVTVTIGRQIIGVLKNIKNKENLKVKTLKKGEKKNAIIVRTKNPIKRFDGSFIKFFENSCILIDSKIKPLATRILGVVPYDLYYKKNIDKLLLLLKNNFIY